MTSEGMMKEICHLKRIY